MEISWPSRRQWKRILGRYRAPWLLLLLSFIRNVWDFIVWALDWKSRVKEAVETVGQVGPVVNKLMEVATSQWIWVGMMMLGILYLVFVPAETHPAESRSVIGVRIANVFAWTAAVTCTLLLWGALVAGYIAVRLPERVAAGTAEEITNLQQSNKRLGDQVSQLRAQTDDLVAQQVPRKLTLAGQLILLGRLLDKQEKGTQVIHHIYVTPLDREAYDYAQQIIDVFVGAKWVGNISPIYLGNPIPAGVYLAVKDANQVPALTKSVHDFLQEAGVHGVIIVPAAEDGRENSITLLIGPKPLREQNVTK